MGTEETVVAIMPPITLGGVQLDDPSMHVKFILAKVLPIIGRTRPRA